MVKIDATTNKVIISTSDYKINVPDATSLPASLDSLENVHMSDFDRLLLKRWDMHMAKGHFRYGLDVLETRSLYPDDATNSTCKPLVAQYNPRRATQRRKPEIMTSVANQPFDDEKFNFSKIDDSKELVFRLHFEEDEHLDNEKENDIIINASPIELGHSLLVPDRLHGKLPQVLSEKSVVLALRLVMLSGLANFKAAFNSLCAYASVNHLHWHIYYMAPKFPLPIETCKAKPLDGENCYEVEDYFAKGFAFQVKSNNDVSNVAKKIFAITKLLCDLNVAHNVFISRGENFDHQNQGATGTSGRYDVIRVFLWARNRVEGGKDPGAFVIATCELAGHILIYNKDEYDNMDLNRVAKAQRESCDKTFNEVKPKVVELLQRLSSSKYKSKNEM